MSSLSPLVRSYVILTIDVHATLQTLNDPEAIVAAKHIEGKKYAAFVLDIVSLFDPLTSQRSYRFQLLGQGLPAQSVNNAIEPSMCVSVYPTASHPTARDGVRPSKELPWPNCYHYTGLTITARVPGIREDTLDATLLDLAQLRVMKNITQEDHHQQQALLHPWKERDDDDDDADGDSDAETVSNKPTSILSQGPPSITSRGTSNVVDDDYVLGASGGKQEDSVDYGRDEEDDSSYEEDDSGDILHHFMEMTRPGDTMIMVTTSYDLTTLPSLPDNPAELLEDIASLDKIVVESKLRAIERARQMDDAAFANTGPGKQTSEMHVIEQDTHLDRTLPSALEAPSSSASRTHSSTVQMDTMEDTLFSGRGSVHSKSSVLSGVSTLKNVLAKATCGLFPRSSR